MRKSLKISMCIYNYPGNNIGACQWCILNSAFAVQYRTCKDGLAKVPFNPKEENRGNQPYACQFYIFVLFSDMYVSITQRACSSPSLIKKASTSSSNIIIVRA